MGQGSRGSLEDWLEEVQRNELEVEGPWKVDQNGNCYSRFLGNRNDPEGRGY